MSKEAGVESFDTDYGVDDSAVETGDTFESFDDFGHGGTESKSVESFDDDEDEGQTTEKETVQPEKGEEIDENSQVKLLKDQEEAGEKEDEKKTDKPDEKSEKSDEESDDSKSPKDDAPEDDGSPAEEVRTLKAFHGDKAYQIPEDATVPVKINGRTEAVGIKELRDSYSGHVRYEEKFEDLSKQSKAFETERDVHMEQVSQVAETMKEIRGLFTAAQAGDAHPLDGVNKLLDTMGINSVEYNKLATERMAQELEIFNEMTDSERDAYWLSKQNKYLVDKQESDRTRTSEEQAQRELDTRISELREAHGVNEDDFNSAYQELLDDGEENITAEQVVQVAKLNPLLDTAEDVLSKYADQLSTDQMNDMVQTIAVTMYKHPEYTIEQIKSDLAEELEVETIISEVTTSKQPAKIKGDTSKKETTTHGYESFDDF